MMPTCSTQGPCWTTKSNNPGDPSHHIIPFPAVLINSIYLNFHPVSFLIRLQDILWFLYLLCFYSLKDTLSTKVIFTLYIIPVNGFLFSFFFLLFIFHTYKVIQLIFYFCYLQIKVHRFYSLLFRACLFLLWILLRFYFRLVGVHRELPNSLWHYALNWASVTFWSRKAFTGAWFWAWRRFCSIFDLYHKMPAGSHSLLWWSEMSPNGYWISNLPGPLFFINNHSPTWRSSWLMHGLCYLSWMPW